MTFVIQESPPDLFYRTGSELLRVDQSRIFSVFLLATYIDLFPFFSTALSMNTALYGVL